jgi:RNA polymerase sigma-70 factor (ECF subfamily)
MAEDRSEVEAAIRAACDSGDYERAATRALEAYGGEILGFLAARLRSQSDAAEVFSMFTEDLWVGLPGFQWKCSMRGFCYTIARNAGNRYKVAPVNRADRNVGLTKASHLSRIVDEVRSRTVAYMRTEVKSKMRQLREQLPEDDQTLLILRVDRNLPWRELAMVMTEGGESLPDAELDKISARMRKRFQLAKDKLKDLARAEGLI